jgi:uncharacterized repeat protein (TIGR03803 family)
MKTQACIVILILMELLVLCSPGGAQNTSPTLKTIYSFDRSDKGAGESPAGDLAIGAGGVLYGTTLEGGTSGCGNVFSLTPPATAGSAWPYAVLHNFTGAATDGCLPFGGVVIGSGGVLYGSTQNGGANNL